MTNIHHTTPHTIHVISRKSPLALLQVEEVKALVPHIDFQVTSTSSFGDNHKEVSLMDKSVAADFFTRELDNALLAGAADIAIHSAKDLPYPLPAGIEVICLTQGGDKSDSLVSKNNLTLQQLPQGSRVGTSSVVRKQELVALRPDLEIVPIRGTIEERIAQVDNGFIDALIVATCALDRLGLSHRSAEKLPFKTHPLQGNLAITAKAGNERVKELFSAWDIRKNFGKVTLVGFGPGDPELLTIKGEKALRKADIIFFDDLTNEAFLANYSAEKIYVGKRSGKHSHHQDEINELIYQAAIEGKEVVRLKGGDPMIFAHGREEIDILKSRLVEVEVIPGISSGVALSSLTQIPLTHRGVSQSVAFVLGHTSPEKQHRTPNTDTLIYYMGGNQASAIAHALIANGRDKQTPVAVVSNVSLPEQKQLFTTLEELRYTIFTTTPVLIIVGNVVGLESPFHAQRILETGTHNRHAENPFYHHTPLIEISERTLSEEEKKRLIKPYDAIIFTSPYGVDYFTKNNAFVGKSKVISVGPTTTKRLLEENIQPAYESETENAAGIIDYLEKNPLNGKRILLPRSDKGIALLSEGLKQLGYEVTDIAVYTNRPNATAAKVDLSEYQKIQFSSPSGVEAFKALYGEKIPENILLTAKGETTFHALEAWRNSVR